MKEERGPARMLSSVPSAEMCEHVTSTIYLIQQVCDNENGLQGERNEKVRTIYS